VDERSKETDAQQRIVQSLASRQDILAELNAPSSPDISEKEARQLRITGYIVLCGGLLMLASHFGIIELETAREEWSLIKHPSDYRYGLLSLGVVGMGLTCLQPTPTRRSKVGLASFFWLMGVALWCIFGSR
jgi:hypothetical protein